MLIKKLKLKNKLFERSIIIKAINNHKLKIFVFIKQIVNCAKLYCHFSSQIQFINLFYNNIKFVVMSCKNS